MGVYVYDSPADVCSLVVLQRWDSLDWSDPRLHAGDPITFANCLGSLQDESNVQLFA